MVKTKDEIIDSLKTLIGDKTDDTALSLLEDVTDTFDDFANKNNSNDNTDWEKKYNELDETWRKKYRDRFFDGNEGDKSLEGNEIGAKTNKPEPEPKEETITYDDLFTEKE